MQIYSLENNTLKELPDGTQINLEGLKGFTELSKEQQNYVCVYFDYFPQKFISATKAGIDPSILYDWFEDRTFATIIDVIKSFHAESLASVEYKEAYTNSKIRATTLKALNAEGYERKENIKQTNNNTLLIADTLGDITKLLKPTQPST